MEILKVNNLSFNYKNSSIKILDSINFSVNKGEIVTICGKSGSGKSTLLRLFKQEISPDGEINGEITFRGNSIKDLDKCTNARKIAFVSQSPDAQIVTDKVLSELAFGLENTGVKPEEMNIRIAEISNYFGLNNLLNSDTFILSGGQKQLLNLASAMCLEPEILLLDEPLSQLDPIASERFLDILKKINQDFGITIIIVEHNLDILFKCSNKICCFDNGKVIAFDEPRKVADKIFADNSDLFEIFPFTAKVSKQILRHNVCNLNIAENRNELSLIKTDKLNYNNDNNSKNLFKETILELSNLYFRYNKESENIIKNLSFNVYDNEILSIVGANGCGKSTFLKLLASIKRPQSGKIVRKTNDYDIGYIPQNPQNLFVKENVFDEISEFNTQSNNENIKEIIKLCDLNNILDLHPYDISGGEQQKVALAKILVRNPQILLFDEPTKGLDSSFKNKLVDIFKKLKENGHTIIIVTHDLDFSAEISDRCGMFFDGKITLCLHPSEFYCKNKYFTTSVRKFCTGILDNITSYSQLKEVFGVKSAKKNPINIKNTDNSDNKILIDTKTTKQWKPDLITLTITAFLMIVTIYLGMKYFEDRKYYFISFLLILETFIPIISSRNLKKYKVEELVFISSFSALIVASRAVFFMLPQFKPMLALVVLSGVCFGSSAGFLVGGVSMFLSNFMFGHGPWTPWQIFAMGVIGGISGIIFDKIKKKKLFLSTFGAFCAIFIYGIIMNISTVLISQVNPTIDMIKSTIIIGFPMDLIHAIATFTFLFLGSDFIIKKINRIKIKFDIFSQ